MNSANLRYATFSFYSLAVLVDHLTTNIGINHYGLAESNAFTLSLIEKGVWSYIDFTMVICTVAATHYLLKYTRVEEKVALFFPLITGVIRFLAGIMNIILII